MELITRSQVPQYLQKGSFFEALPADLLRIEVPSKCLKADLSIQTDRDLSHLLHSVRFWGVHQVPEEVVEYMMKNIHEGVLVYLAKAFPNVRAWLANVVAENIEVPEKVVVLSIRLRLARNILKLMAEQNKHVFVPQSWYFFGCVDDIASIAFLNDKKVPVDIPNFVNIAASCGSIKSLRYAHSSGWTIPPESLCDAAYNDRLECVKFLHEVCGVAYTLQTMLCAALANDFELVRYLHETGCPWDEEVCAAFAAKDALDCLQFAHEEGCPWDGRTCRAASKAGSTHCLDYARASGCTENGSSTTPDKTNSYQDYLARDKQSQLDGNVMAFRVVATGVLIAVDLLWYDGAGLAMFHGGMSRGDIVADMDAFMILLILFTILCVFCNGIRNTYLYSKVPYVTPEVGKYFVYLIVFAAIRCCFSNYRMCNSLRCDLVYWSE